MAHRWKVALGQVRPVLGEVKANVEKHLEWVDRAEREQASVIVFPELGLTGYQLQDLTLDVARPLNDPEIAKLIRRSASIDILFSFVEESADHRFYISSVYAADGQVQAVHRKVYLPTYGLFDEGRYFAGGETFSPFSTRFGLAGMLICEDAWHVSSPYLLALAGAKVLFIPAAGPARSVTQQAQFGSQAFWHDLLRVYAQLFGVILVFVNRVGFEDGVNFFGGSGILSPHGEWLATAPLLEEALVIGEVDLTEVRRARYVTPLLRDEKTDVVSAVLQQIRNGRRGGWSGETGH